MNNGTEAKGGLVITRTKNDGERSQTLLTVKSGSLFGERIVVTINLAQIYGEQLRLCLAAPKEILIYRRELLDESEWNPRRSKIFKLSEGASIVLSLKGSEIEKLLRAEKPDDDVLIGVVQFEVGSHADFDAINIKFSWDLEGVSFLEA